MMSKDLHFSILVSKKKEDGIRFSRTVKRLCEKHKPYLEILRIDGAQLTDQALNSIAQCDKLKLITIEFCTNMTGLNFDIFHVRKFLARRSLFFFD